MKYYRVNIDFHNFINIDATELEKAIYAFRMQAPVVFKQGATDRISNIVPDYHKIKGWNATCKLTDDDWADINKNKDCFEAKKEFERIQNKISHLIETKQQHLIGKNIEIPELNHPTHKQISEATKNLTDKFKINV